MPAPPPDAAWARGPTRPGAPPIPVTPPLRTNARWPGSGCQAPPSVSAPFSGRLCRRVACLPRAGLHHECPGLHRHQWGRSGVLPGRGWRQGGVGRGLGVCRAKSRLDLAGGTPPRGAGSRTESRSSLGTWEWRPGRRGAPSCAGVAPAGGPRAGPEAPLRFPGRRQCFFSLESLLTTQYCLTHWYRLPSPNAATSGIRGGRYWDSVISRLRKNNFVLKIKVVLMGPQRNRWPILYIGRILCSYCASVRGL